MKHLLLKPDGLSSEFLRTGRGTTEWARIEAGLRLANILSATERMDSYADGEPWHRGGAETYIADASILVARASDPNRRVIAKALVSFATDIEVKVAVWLQRRTFLSQIGILVPILYSGRNGVIFEEFIDRPLTDLDLKDESILAQLGDIGARLDFYGFSTLSFVDDLMLKEGKIRFVDFGFDLGEPSGRQSSHAQIAIAKLVPSDSARYCLSSYDATRRILSETIPSNCRDRPVR